MMERLLILWNKFIVTSRALDCGTFDILKVQIIRWYDQKRLAIKITLKLRKFRPIKRIPHCLLKSDIRICYVHTKAYCPDRL